MQAKDIKNITLIGAGTMGMGIGQEFARAGFQVTYFDVSLETLQEARKRLRSNLEQMVDWCLIGADEIESILNRVQTTNSLEEAAKDADMVVEAVFEDLELKKKIFNDLDKLCPPHTILASNTSSFMPSVLAATTNRPDRMLVFHFFYPPHLLPLIEIVPSELTSQETLDVSLDIARAIGKSPVVLQKEAVGFIVNRLQVALLREALYLVEQGIATAQDVDIAVKQSFGRRLSVAGPIEMAEVMDDWNQTLQFSKYILQDIDASKQPSPLMIEKVESGEWGAKKGQGFYKWTPEYETEWKKKLWTTLADFQRRDNQR